MLVLIIVRKREKPDGTERNNQSLKCRTKIALMRNKTYQIT